MYYDTKILADIPTVKDNSKCHNHGTAVIWFYNKLVYLHFRNTFVFISCMLRPMHISIKKTILGDEVFLKMYLRLAFSLCMKLFAEKLN